MFFAKQISLSLLQIDKTGYREVYVPLPDLIRFATCLNGASFLLGLVEGEVLEDLGLLGDLGLDILY